MLQCFDTLVWHHKWLSKEVRLSAENIVIYTRQFMTTFEVVKKHVFTGQSFYEALWDS